MLSQSALACSCVDLTVQERFENADHVFTAKVIGVHLQGENRTIAGHPNDTVEPNSIILEYSFDPLVDHKGDSSEVDFLRTMRSSCEPNLNLGQLYTFFVHKGEYIGGCGSVLSTSEEQEFLQLITGKKKRSEASGG